MNKAIPEMKERASKNNRVKVCFIQPIQSPYWTERFKILAQRKDLDIVLLLERENHTRRPGWCPEKIEGIHTRVLGSALVGTCRDVNDVGYKSYGARYIPWRLPLALMQLKPDVLVLSNATELIAALSIRYLLGFRIALMIEDTIYSTRHFSWLSKKLKAWSYRRANHWFAYSDDSRSYLRHIGITKKIEYSPWSVDMAAFERDTVRLPALSGSEPISERSVLFVGQFVHGKGFLFLLKAWADLPSKTRSNVKLLLVGDGPFRKEAEEFCADKKLADVIFLGQVPYDRVKAILGKADLFVLPTVEDVYGLAILEAMASKVPVIITPFTGARELIEPGINGWIVDPFERGALTAALAHALSPDVDLLKMGEAARVRVKTMDNMKVMSDLAQSLTKLAKNGH